MKKLFLVLFLICGSSWAHPFIIVRAGSIVKAFCNYGSGEKFDDSGSVKLKESQVINGETWRKYAYEGWWYNLEWRVTYNGEAITYPPDEAPQEWGPPIVPMPPPPYWWPPWWPPYPEITPPGWEPIISWPIYPPPPGSSPPDFSSPSPPPWWPVIPPVVVIPGPDGPIYEFPLPVYPLPPVLPDPVGPVPLPPDWGTGGGGGGSGPGYPDWNAPEISVDVSQVVRAIAESRFRQLQSDVITRDFIRAGAETVAAEVKGLQWGLQYVGDSAKTAGQFVEREVRAQTDILDSKLWHIAKQVEQGNFLASYMHQTDVIRNQILQRIESGDVVQRQQGAEMLTSLGVIEQVLSGHADTVEAALNIVSPWFRDGGDFASLLDNIDDMLGELVTIAEKSSVVTNDLSIVLTNDLSVTVTNDFSVTVTNDFSVTVTNEFSVTVTNYFSATNNIQITNDFNYGQVTSDQYDMSSALSDLNSITVPESEQFNDAAQGFITDIGSTKSAIKTFISSMFTFSLPASIPSSGSLSVSFGGASIAGVSSLNVNFSGASGVAEVRSFLAWVVWACAAFCAAAMVRNLF